MKQQANTKTTGYALTNGAFLPHHSHRTTPLVKAAQSASLGMLRCRNR